MEITLTTTRESVFANVARRMEWEGTRNPLEEENYSRVAMVEADKSLFQSLFDDAAMNAIDVCRPFLVAVSNTDKSLTIKLELSAETSVSELQQAIDSMLTYHVLAQWLEIVSPSRGESASKKKDAGCSKILSIIYHHKKPVRHASSLQHQTTNEINP